MQRIVGCCSNNYRTYWLLNFCAWLLEGLSLGIFDIPEVSPRQMGCTKVAGTESSWEWTNSPTKSCNTDKPVSRRSLYKINSKEALTTYINPINKFTSHTSVPLSNQQKLFNTLWWSNSWPIMISITSDNSKIRIINDMLDLYAKIF